MILVNMQRHYERSLNTKLTNVAILCSNCGNIIEHDLYVMNFLTQSNR